MKKKEKKVKPQKRTKEKKGIFIIVVLSIAAAVLFANAVKQYTAEIPAGKLNIQLNGVALPEQQSVNAPSVPTVTLPSPSETQNIDTAPDKKPQQNDSTADEEKPQVDENEEILRVVRDGVNALKAENATYKGVKSQSLVIELTECSVPSIVNMVNWVLEFFAGEEITEYEFKNGKAWDEEEKTEIAATDAFPPSGKPFSLTVQGIASAKKEQQGENTVYTVVLVPEQGTLENPRPIHHDSACDVIDFSTFELPAGEVTKAEMNYGGATVSITLDPNGRVVGYYERLETKGGGEGNVMGISAGGTMEGYIDESWTITY